MLLALVFAAVLAMSSSRTAVALYDFDATEADELSFRRGDKFTILGTADGEDEWVRAGAANGEEGLVPATYLRQEPDKPEKALSPAAATLAFAAAAALADADNIAPGTDPAVAEAMRSYRKRRAVYDVVPAAAAAADQLGRWGVRLDLDASSTSAAMTSASVSAGGQTADFPDAATAQAEAEPEPEPAEHRSGVACRSSTWWATWRTRSSWPRWLSSCGTSGSVRP